MALNVSPAGVVAPMEQAWGILKDYNSTKCVNCGKRISLSEAEAFSGACAECADPSSSHGQIAARLRDYGA